MQHSPLIWLSVVKRKIDFPTTFLFVVILNLYLQGIDRVRTLLATLDRSDIRGLSTARPVFIAELPLSLIGSSVNFIPKRGRGFSLRSSDPVYALNTLC